MQRKGLYSERGDRRLGFNLPEETAVRLRIKFKEFQKARKKIHELLADYVVDYRRLKGTTLTRQERLREKYSRRAPKLTHLIFNGEGGIGWTASDIAIVMGRNQSSIARTLSNMQREDGWCSRLLALRKSVKSPNGNSTYIYHQDIFDLLLDRYEEEYLLRFSNPRRGNPDNALNIKEVRRFWSHLKSDAEIQQERLIHQEEQSEWAALPPMGWRDILSLIWSKVFTIRIGTFVSILSAICFELVRRWPGFTSWIIIISLLVLMSCVLFLRSRKMTPHILSSIGAVALLFTIIWGAGLLSSDGVIRIPGGATLSLPASEQEITLMPRDNNGQLGFAITVLNHYNVKEFLYRISPDVEYRSTGFLRQLTPETGSPVPDFTIENTQMNGVVELDVKYIDTSDKEHGPWAFSFDIDAERFNLRRQFILNIEEPWVELYRSAGRTFAEINIPLFPTVREGFIKAIVCGIDTEAPDTVFTPETILQLEDPLQIIDQEEDNIQYITSYLLFGDGTSSDIRRSDIIRL